MKTTFALLIFCFCSLSLLGQAPHAMKYQAVVRDATGAVMANKSVSFKISIVAASTTGTPIYTETHTGVNTGPLGLVDLIIGKGTPVKGDFSGIPWGDNTYYARIEIDIEGGSSFTFLGTSQMLSVPYALYARAAENGFSGDYNDLVNKPAGSKNGDMMYWNGKKWEMIPAGLNGQVLRMVNGIPVWFPGSPMVTTNGISNVTISSATAGATVTSSAGDTVLARGFCWSTLPFPTISDYKTVNGSGTGTFSANITGLNSNTLYYIRGYAINSQGAGYGNLMTFTTDKVLTLATVTTSTAAFITTNGATLGGNVIHDGDTPVTERGIVYSTSQNPTLADNKIAIGAGMGAFSMAITGLPTNTTYYVRAYAINSVGTAYGSQISFTVGQVSVLASVVTSAATGITISGAVLGGEVTNDGNSAVTERGVVFATTQNPTVQSTKATMGSGKGVFSGPVTGLSPGTTYYARAYAINSVGTAYGQQISFTTGLVASLPTVTTKTASGVTISSAVLGGDVTSDGNAVVTERGVVYSTSPIPTVLNTKVSMGSGTGSFDNTVTGLAENTTWYVRAYAINSVGTAYGNQVTFTTPGSSAGTFTDPRDNLNYNWIKYGDKIWMTRNLAWLPAVSSPTVGSDTAKHYYVYGYLGSDVASAKAASNYSTFGVLYNWAAAVGACPAGWHLPTDGEWKLLEMSLGMSPLQADSSNWRGTNEGTKIKTTTGWIDNGNGTNSSGFSALPAGYRFTTGTFIGSGIVSYWWSSTIQESQAWYRSLYYDRTAIYREPDVKVNGYSIRCVKD